MILIHDIALPPDTDFSRLDEVAARVLRCEPKAVRWAKLYRKSVDARKKTDVHFCCTVLAQTTLNEDKLARHNSRVSVYRSVPYRWPATFETPQTPPVVIGFGPAGLFAGLYLARAGLKPVIIERGQDVDTRTADVERFWQTNQVKRESNVQFGEGGAGAFSDGKLNTGIKDERCRAVLETFVEFGAPQHLLYDAKPHIGTDVLRQIIKAMRREILRLGGTVRFGCRMTDLVIKDHRLTGVVLADGSVIPCDRAVLAMGHSARDTFLLLQKNGLALCRKPFSVGVRIEHLQRDIDRALYGSFAGHPALPPADYKLAVHPEGRGVYTFCMCPGGVVVNASDEAGHTVVNGMSYAARDGENANSAVLVSVEPDDLPGEDVLAGVWFQRLIEEKAYRPGGVPVTTVGHFLKGLPARFGRVKPTVRPATVFAEAEEILPDFAVTALRKALPDFAARIPGFDDDEAILTFAETRSSSPIRVLRGPTGESLSLNGLYPAGEGCGYAGGIMSAAVDGLKAAEQILAAMEKNRTK